MIILGCNKESICNKYYPNVSERESYQLKGKNNKSNKEDIPNKNISDIGIKIYNTINNSNSSSVHINNITTNMNSTDNYMKQQKNLILNKPNGSIQIDDQPPKRIEGQ